MTTPAIVQSNESFADWNDEGISFLCSGMYEQAVVAFRSALSKLSSSFCDADHDGQVNNNEGCVSSSGGGADRSLELEIHEIEDGPQGRTSTSDHNTLILHASAFRISRVSSPSSPMMDSTSREICRKRATIISGALLFNLGLAYHLMALSHSNTRGGVPTLLRRVQNMYCLAELALIKKERDIRYCCLNASQRRILLAINNNQAHVSYHFFHREASEHALSKMRDMLSRYGIDEDRDKHFVLNVICASGNIGILTSPAA